MDREQSVRGEDRAHDVTAMMRSAPLWQEALMAEHAELRSRLKDAIDADGQCEEAV